MTESVQTLKEFNAIGNRLDRISIRLQRYEAVAEKLPKRDNQDVPVYVRGGSVFWMESRERCKTVSVISLVSLMSVLLFSIRFSKTALLVDSGLFIASLFTFLS